MIDLRWPLGGARLVRSQQKFINKQTAATSDPSTTERQDGAVWRRHRSATSVARGAGDAAEADVAKFPKFSALAEAREEAGHFRANQVRHSSITKEKTSKSRSGQRHATVKLLVGRPGSRRLLPVATQ